MAVFTPVVNPDNGSGSEKRYLIKQATFGNGYNLRLQDGIRASFEDFNLTWTTLNLSQYTSIRDALDGFSGGVVFQWQNFDGLTRNYYIEGYSKSVNEGSPNSYTISTTFKECAEI